MESFRQFLKMSNSRKSCLYKDCEKEPGNTLFKFPTERDRFISKFKAIFWISCLFTIFWIDFLKILLEVWCLNAGLNLHGKVDINETRYLCERHFHSKYINIQARRKVLVHTGKAFIINFSLERSFTLYVQFSNS